jgi:hypothetical protein
MYKSQIPNSKKQTKFKEYKLKIIENLKQEGKHV